MQLHAEAVTGSVSAAGAEITYHDTGTPGASAPIVLVHGTGGSTLAHYRTVFPMLAGRHRVLGVDFGPADSFDAIVRQVEAVIRSRTAGEPARVVGYSLGAAVAAAIAARQTVSVEKLVVICGWGKSDHVQKARYELWQRLFKDDRESLKVFSTLTAFGQPYLAGRTASELQGLISARVFAPGIDSHMRINEDLDILADLSRIRTPTLVIGGTVDQMTPMRHSYLLFGAIEDARLAEIPTGHAATTERPAQVFKLIDDFIREVPGATAPGTILDTGTI
jgi:pimeloyl-ACP methyl ester carboxylesterase